MIYLSQLISTVALFGFLPMTLNKTFSVLLLSGMLAACSNVPRIVTEYRIDVQQGNVVTQEMVAQLRPGLTRDQVRFALGSPLLVDLFHADRWDYLYRLQNGRSGDVQTRKLSVFFDKEGRLVSTAGDITPASVAPEAPVSTEKMKVIEVDPAALQAIQQDDKGILERVADKFK